MNQDFNNYANNLKRAFITPYIFVCKVNMFFVVKIWLLIFGSENMCLLVFIIIFIFDWYHLLKILILKFAASCHYCHWRSSHCFSVQRLPGNSFLRQQRWHMVCLIDLLSHQNWFWANLASGLPLACAAGVGRSGGKPCWLWFLCNDFNSKFREWF